MQILTNQTYMIIAGNMGLAVNALSFYYSFRLTVTGDEGVISKEQVNKLCTNIEDVIQEQIDLMEKGAPAVTSDNASTTPETKKDK